MHYASEGGVREGEGDEGAGGGEEAAESMAKPWRDQLAVQEALEQIDQVKLAVQQTHLYQALQHVISSRH